MINFLKKGKGVIIKSPSEAFKLLDPLYFLRDVLWSTRYYTRYILPKRKSLHELKKLKNSKKGKSAFVFANGPSLANLSFEKVSKYQNEGFDVFAVNSFISNQKNFIPNFYVLSDPAYFRRDIIETALKKRVEADLDLINKHKITCFLPFEFDGKKNLEKFYYFNDAECLTFNNFSNPLIPRSFFSMTAYKALLISIYLGYDKVYISGFDNDYFLGINNNEENEVSLLDKHFYVKDIDRKLIKSIGFNSIKDVLLDSYWLFYFLSKFSKYNIVNLDKKGLCDEFSKNHSLDVYL